MKHKASFSSFAILLGSFGLSTLVRLVWMKNQAFIPIHMDNIEIAGPRSAIGRAPDS